MNHKHFCCCQLCRAAREVEKRGKPKRRLPKFVLEGIREKEAKYEEFMMSQGKMLIKCPKCKHTTYMKIGPRIKCECCCHMIE